MILSLPGESSYQQKYVICLRKGIDEATFLRKARVKQGTYAGDLLKTLYAEMFHQSLELKSDYITYYSVEYATFKEYLRKRFLLTCNVASLIAAQFEDNAQIVYFHPSYYFLREEYGMDFLSKLLERKVGK